MFGITNWIKEKLLKKYAKKYLTSAVVALLGAFGGYLKAIGHVDVQVIEDFISSAINLSAETVPVLIAIIYGVFTTGKAEKKAKEEVKEIK